MYMNNGLETQDSYIGTPLQVLCMESHCPSYVMETSSISSNSQIHTIYSNSAFSGLVGNVITCHQVYVILYSGTMRYGKNYNYLAHILDP